MKPESMRRRVELAGLTMRCSERRRLGSLDIHFLIQILLILCSSEALHELRYFTSMFSLGFSRCTEK